MMQLENDLALEFNRGSKSAFTALYKLLYHPVFLFAKNLVPADEAADITADSFFKLWKRHEHFNSFPDIRAFLYITARNACFDYLKHQKVKAEKQREIVALTEQDTQSVIRAEIESELISIVRAEIENLAPREGKVFTLAYFDGYKNSEIAEMLQITDQTVRNVKTAALKKIKAALFCKNIQNGIAVVSMTALSIFLDAIFLFLKP
jgi:RNA polymerase sigma-70 factor (ECF subfamily)